ncbi:MAG: hypothetical protein JWM99_497, partial [Verrucomicrobiales bacterium]|nr:hypothetical protein [Verrucomicrobiales bacterium]
PGPQLMSEDLKRTQECDFLLPNDTFFAAIPAFSLLFSYFLIFSHIPLSHFSDPMFLTINKSRSRLSTLDFNRIAVASAQSKISCNVET